MKCRELGHCTINYSLICHPHHPLAHLQFIYLCSQSVKQLPTAVSVEMQMWHITLPWSVQHMVCGAGDFSIIECFRDKPTHKVRYSKTALSLKTTDSFSQHTLLYEMFKVMYMVMPNQIVARDAYSIFLYNISYQSCMDYADSGSHLFTTWYLLVKHKIC